MINIILAIVFSCLFFLPSQALDSTIIGKSIIPFSAPIAQGGTFSFSQIPNAKALVIVFTCNHCPFAGLYTQRLNAFHQYFAPLGIPLVGVNPMDSLIYEDETLAEMQKKAKADSLTFPYLQDADQSIARACGAEYTPQVFVIAKRKNTWQIVYKGIIDDNGNEPEIARPYLHQVAQAILMNQEIEQPILSAFGCKIYYRPSP